MGCIASLESSPSSTPEDVGKKNEKDNISTLETEKSPSIPETPKFMGVLEKPTLLVRDQFHSKYDGSLMHKWRKVDIIDVAGDDYSKIFVHFQGWAETFDHWIDLHEETGKVAPLLLLSKAQCTAGKELTEEDLRITKEYLLTGLFRPQPLIPQNLRSASLRMSSDDGGLQQSLPIEFFVEGKMLDILDIFTPVNSTEQKKKWRKARIINVDNQRIRITYIGWNSKFDETLDIVENADRISPIGTKTTEQSARSLSALKESPQRNSRSSRNRSSSRNHSTNAGSSDTSEDEDEDDEDDDATTFTQDSSVANATTATTNSGGFLQSFARFMTAPTVITSANGNANGTGNNKSAAGGNNSGSPNKKKKGVSSTSSVASERSTKSGKRKKKSKHGKYSSYEEARDEIMKKTAEEMAIELEKERKFLEALGRKRLHVIEMDGDGNCLFRAISHQLYLTEDKHEILRRKCIEHLIAHKNRFSLFCVDDYDEHLREMAKVGTWGDELEIRALEEILDRHIFIYSSESAKLDEPMNTNIEEEAILRGVVPIMLSYHGQNHYNSIYDERYPLPLPLRGSNLLLQSRMGLIDNKLGLPTAVQNNGASGYTLPISSTTTTNSSNNNTNNSINNTSNPPSAAAPANNGNHLSHSSASNINSSTSNPSSSSARQSLSRTSSGTGGNFQGGGGGGVSSSANSSSNNNNIMNNNAHHPSMIMGGVPAPYPYASPMMMYPGVGPGGPLPPPGVMPMPMGMPMIPMNNVGGVYNGYSMPVTGQPMMPSYHSMPTMYPATMAGPSMGDPSNSGNSGIASSGKNVGTASARSSFGSATGNSSSSSLPNGNNGSTSGVGPGNSPNRPSSGSYYQPTSNNNGIPMAGSNTNNSNNGSGNGNMVPQGGNGRYLPPLANNASSRPASGYYNPNS